MQKIQIDQVAGYSFVCSGRSAVGVILNPQDNTVILIDSSFDRSMAKDIDAAICAKGWQITTILNTHSHADHCGGNAYFQSKYLALKIYATEFESVFINDPSLEPWYLSAGARPIAELHNNKFLKAEPSCVTDYISYKSGQIKVNNLLLEIVLLLGHTLGMIGVINLQDRVMYVGDGLFAAEIIAKHGVLFYTDIFATRASLAQLLAIKDRYDYCVLYHGGVVLSSDMSLLVQQNLYNLQLVEDFIFTQISSCSKISDALLVKVVMQHFGVKDDIVQWHLTKTSVAAFVAELQRQGKIMCFVNQGEMIYSSLR